MKKASSLFLGISVTLFLGTFAYPTNGNSDSQATGTCPHPDDLWKQTNESKYGAMEFVACFPPSQPENCYCLYRDPKGVVHRVCLSPDGCGQEKPDRCDSIETIDDEHCGTKLRVVDSRTR